MSNVPDKPTVFTAAVQREIVKLVRDGNYFKTACIAAGTTPQAVEYWQRLYEDGVEHAQVFANFFGSLARARALAEVDALSDLKAARPGWQAHAWFLDRRYHRRWGKSAEDKPVKVQVVKQSDPIKEFLGSDINETETSSAPEAE